MIDINEWANYWRNECGLNVFPADTRSKKTYEAWSKWQNTPINDEQHNEWKKTDAFAKGMAIIAGKVWHREDLEGYYLCFIDQDNQKAIDEVCTVFGAKDIKELSQMTVVEQHLDDHSKAHAYFYTPYILKKKSSDATRNLKDKLDGNELPAIEVKCQNDGLAYCTPSPHKDGHNYEIIGTTKIGTFNGKEIEDKLFEVYRKYELLTGITSNGDNNKIPMKELLELDLVIDEGHNRHGEVLRVIESLYAKKNSKSLEGIYNEAWQWNQTHCNPPLTQSEFDRQWKDGIKFVERTRVSNQEIILLQQQQLEQQLKTDSQIIYKIVSNVNNIPKAYYIDDKSRQINYGALKEYGINLEKCIINIAPRKIRYYYNPLFPNIEPKIELEFQNGNELEKLGPYISLGELLKALENKGYILNKNKAADAFNSVVSAMREKNDEMIEHITDVTTSGYYFINDVLVMKNISQSSEEIHKESVAECCNLLNRLSSGWKNKDVFPTVLKWGLISPFSFIIKSNIEEWVPWLQMFGWGKSGKTTLGTLVSMIWNRSTKVKKGFTNMDTIPRLGEIISQDTYPVLINEVGSLYESGRFNRYKSIIETIKHSVESTSTRGLFKEQNNYQEIPALSPLILTSNYAPPNEGGFGRRFISIHFPKDEKKEVGEEEKFKKLLQDKKRYLKVLGDFTMQQIVRDPQVLLKEDWKDVAKKILIEFYQFASLETPDWIDYFIEQKDAVDESSEKTMFALRAFLVDKINSAYSRNINNGNIFNGLNEKLEYCLEYSLIPFLHRVKSKGRTSLNTVIITHDILDEMNKSWNKIENITTLKDVGVQLGFAYDGKYLNGIKTKVVFGPMSKLVEFIDPEILSEDSSK